MVFNLHPEGGPLNPRKPKDRNSSLDQGQIESIKSNEFIDGEKGQTLLARIKELLAEGKVVEAKELWEESIDNEKE